MKNHKKNVDYLFIIIRIIIFFIEFSLKIMNFNEFSLKIVGKVMFYVKEASEKVVFFVEKPSQKKSNGFPQKQIFGFFS